jgi:hypothetical protein
MIPVPFFTLTLTLSRQGGGKVMERAFIGGKRGIFFPF